MSASHSRIRTAILIGGRGSNMASLLAAARDPAYPATIVLVLSNKADAAGLAIAQAAGVETLVIEHGPFAGDRAAHEASIDRALRERAVELICLAGYMRLLTPFLVGRWAGRMLNIHPSLLPEYPGLDTHRRALAAGAARHGCTVHLVTDETDAGPILDQAEIPVLPGDDEAMLAAPRPGRGAWPVSTGAGRLCQLSASQDLGGSSLAAGPACAVETCIQAAGDQDGRYRPPDPARADHRPGLSRRRQAFWASVLKFVTYVIGFLVVLLLFLWWWLV